MSEERDATATFEVERPRLVGLAYRITGSRTAADDLVQDAWLRWQRSDPSTIERPAAWLTTVTSRLALDHLKAVRHDREVYVGPWLPEPANPAPDPAQRVELAESLTLTFLALLERLGPSERVVFLLADVFALPFDEIAPIVDKTPEACRQMASRARTRVRDGRPRFAPTDDEAWQVTAAFLAAAEAGDLAGLTALLSADAVLVSDGGADHRAARRPVGASQIPRFIANLMARTPADVELEIRLINGQPGLVLRRAGEAVYATACAVADGQIQHIEILVNPAKLATLDSEPIE